MGQYWFECWCVCTVNKRNVIKRIYYYYYLLFRNYIRSYMSDITTILIYTLALLPWFMLVYQLHSMWPFCYYTLPGLSFPLCLFFFFYLLLMISSVPRHFIVFDFPRHCVYLLYYLTVGVRYFCQQFFPILNSLILENKIVIYFIFNPCLNPAQNQPDNKDKQTTA